MAYPEHRGRALETAIDSINEAIEEELAELQEAMENLKEDANNA